MRVGPLLVGAAIGGGVWILAIRAASSAATKASNATTTESPPLVAPGTDAPVPDAISGGSTDAGPAELVGAAERAPDGTPVVVAGSQFVAGVGVGGLQSYVVDAVTQTVREDTTASIGGAGVDQQGNSIARGETSPADAPPVPTYRPGTAAMADFVRARWGISGTDGMTDSQIATLVAEAARLGGVAI